MQLELNMSNSKLTPKQALLVAIERAGSQTSLARQLGLKNASQISSMLNRDGRCSAKYVLKVSNLTKVPCYQLRPDLYPEPANDPINQPESA